MATTYSAREIADWFIAWAENIDAEVSNLKLQKILYYAQGNYLARTGTPLFADQVQAWGHGPVVPDVYHSYKQFGPRAIDPDTALDDSFDWGKYRDVEQFLLEMWNRYGSLAAWALRERTHKEAPWVDAFDAGYNVCITQDAMRTFFTENVGA